jgi:hypothetical protein
MVSNVTVKIEYAPSGTGAGRMIVSGPDADEVKAIATERFDALRLDWRDPSGPYFGRSPDGSAHVAMIPFWGCN